jgi:predicted ATPase
LQICLTYGWVRQGWALVQQRQGELGIARIQQGLTAYRARGGVASLPLYLALLAEAHGSIGQIAQGLAILAEAQALVDKHGEHA